MPVTLETQIMTVLRTMTGADRPATIGDLARRFGLSAAIVSASARRLVDEGTARASMVEIRGVNTLHGLLPQPAQSGVAAEK